MSGERCRIAIVGGGPAGLAAALGATAAGADGIVLLERKKSWGVPANCAGFVPRLLAREVDFSPAAVAAAVQGIRFFLRGRELRFLPAPGYILDRPVFEAQLAGRAGAAGANLRQPATVESIAGRQIGYRLNGRRFTLEADYVIGADGPRSRVRAAAGAGSQSLAIGRQQAFAPAGTLDTAEIHFDPEYGAGYAWCFPAPGERVNVGIGLHPQRSGRARSLLAGFAAAVADRGLITGPPRELVAGPIPAGGPAARTVQGRLILAGDAAGQANPLTGAGLHGALACGRLAGEAAARAADEDDPTRLEEYEAAWRDLFARPLERARVAAESLESVAPADYEAAVRRAWFLGKA